MINKKFLTKLGFVLALSWVSSFSSLAMEDENLKDEETKIVVHKKDLSEHENELLIDVNSKSEDKMKGANSVSSLQNGKHYKEESALLIRVEDDNSRDNGRASSMKEIMQNQSKWLKTRKGLNDIFQGRSVGRTTALLIIPNSPYEKPADAVSYGVIKHFDNTFFDEVTMPRRLLQCCLDCCCPEGLYILKGGTSLAGAGLISLTMTAFSNGVLGDFFNYPVEGAVSYSMLAVSIVLNGPVAGLIYYDLGKKIVEKKRISFQPASSLESEGNHPYARLFRKSKTHKILEKLLIPASAAYALPPIAFWLKVQEYFKAYGTGMSTPIVIYYAKPYYDIGEKFLWEWFADNYYIPDHGTKEMRKALAAALDGLAKTLEIDCDPKRGGIKGKLTKEIWRLLKENSKTFGKDMRRNDANNPKAKNDKDKETIHNPEDKDAISLLSLLLTKSTVAENEPIDEYQTHWNRTLATLAIEEKTAKEKVINQTANGLMWLNLIPGFRAESHAVTTALSLFGVSNTPAEVIGWTLAGLFSTRMLLETEFHKKTISSWSQPLTPYQNDHINLRRAITGKVLLYSALNATIFTILTYWALDDIPFIEKWTYVGVTFLRYFSLFYAIGSKMYNEALTAAVTRNKDNPSLENKKTHLLALIERAKHLLRYELTNETIAELTQGIYKTK